MTIAKDNVNLPIDSCSINLSKFNKHDPPANYEFDFIASKLKRAAQVIDPNKQSHFYSTDNDSYRVHVKRHTKTQIFMGEKSESCLIETWCDFKVNGVQGWGAAEWQYRNEKCHQPAIKF